MAFVVILGIILFGFPALCFLAGMMADDDHAD